MSDQVRDRSRYSLFAPEQPARTDPVRRAEALGSEETEFSIPACFERFARLHPSGIAVKSNYAELSWDQLNRMANRVARAILERSKQQGRAIAVLLDRESFIVASVGVLKAGCVGVPLATDHPPSRCHFVLKETEANLIVTDHRHLSRATELAQSGYAILNIDELASDLPVENLELAISASDLCLITYTSGSTGEPKGVMSTHEKVIHGFDYGEHFHIGPDDRFTDLGSGLRNPFSALLRGARLFPWYVKEQGLAGLADWLIQEEVSVLRAGPRVFRQFVSGFSGLEKFPKLRGIILAGEPVLKSDVELYKRNFDASCVLINLLGAHEVGPFRIFVINKNTEMAGERAPAGYGIPGKEALILDDQRHPKQAGETGEIGVVSRYPSPGYWRRPALNEASFVADPRDSARKIYLTGDIGRLLADGCLEHLGRKDFRAKIGGFTVDMSEVEKALMSHPEVKETVVTARPDCTGDSRLIAYFVPSNSVIPSVTSLRNHLKELLPVYMVPAVFVKLEQFPATVVGTGKIDRSALPEPGNKRPELENPFVPPATPIEKLLAGIWADVLSLSDVGTNDNFFELGGNSLSATRIIARLIGLLPLELPVHALLDCPTIAEMATLVAKIQPQMAGREDLDRILGELEIMSEDDARRLLVEDNEGKSS
jgi:acyl-coenzyme A synthetase/AMP-(fatty) acid ligase